MRITSSRTLSLAAAVLAVASLGLTACSSSSDAASTPSAAATLAAPDSPQRVDAATFASAVNTPGVTIVDVRTPAEFAAEHIDGAVNIDVEGPDFVTQISALDPSKTYAVYCRAGNRSQVAVAQMSQAGFTHIWELQTGINGWTSAGYLTVS